VTDQLIPTDLPARTQVISGLRQFADYLDKHPDIPVNEYGWDLSDFPRQDDDTAGRAEVDRVADILGVTPDDDTASGGHYTAAKTFGRITYNYVHITPQRRAIHRAWASYSDSVTPDDSATAHDSPEAA
jgi:hypothetical protein